jgi:7-alpha-hydroxysteroid dehydrogenase
VSAPPGRSTGCDPFRLDGKVALITGAGRGIGAAIAAELARAGADLVLVARGSDDLQRVAAAARDLGRSALVIAADLTDISVLASLVDGTVAKYGRLDVLVNNAGGAARRRTSKPLSSSSKPRSGSTSSGHPSS